MAEYRNKMDVVKNLTILHQLHQMIQSEHTGGVERISSVLHISHTSVIRRLEQLRNMGAVIEYDKAIQSYVYLNDFVFELTIKS